MKALRIHEQIRAAFEKKGLTYADLARQIAPTSGPGVAKRRRIHRSLLPKKLRGDVTMSTAEAESLATALGGELRFVRTKSAA